MKQKVELIKRLDEHICILSCSSSAPIDFLILAIDDFKLYLINHKKQIEDSQKPAVSEEAPKE